MGSKTNTKVDNKTSSYSTNTYGLGPQTNSADIQTLRGMVANPNEVDPSIAYSFARRRQDLDNSFLNPLGAYTSPAVRDAAGRTAGRGLNMESAVMQSAGRREAQDRAFQQQSYIAGLTAPPVVQTGGSTTGTVQGTQTQTYNPGIGSYISSGLGVAAGFL